MIYVEHNNEKPMEHRLATAQTTIDLVFSETDYALAFVSEISANRHPEFWKAANRIVLRQAPLVIFSIRYPLDSDLPVYEISWNPRFATESGLAYSEDWVEEMVHVNLPDNNDFIYVRRLGIQQYEHVA
ncbi:hypothetical protein ABB26_11200 [Stenotrophomonas humi]|uniref:Uncharacterized protein n=1 Tax=Stenotrophomonas humi TaxID=405444 RepID=A0A0R0CEJ6_9GAMM|nr:hypothetical protein [Stenotrophomonas humi]KRG63763.1 hypothetical protein ABB26_11200 [Stenotrophomonas humi]